MSFSLPKLESDVSRNAHLLYKAQHDLNTVLKVDSKGNLQRVGFLGKMGTAIADIFTFGRFSAKRAENVIYISRKTLEKLNEHLLAVKQTIESKNPDLNNVEIIQKIRNAINITPQRSMFKVQRATYEPFYAIKLEKLQEYGLRTNLTTSETHFIGPAETLVKKFGEVKEPIEVLEAKVYLNATELANKIHDITIKDSNDLVSLSPEELELTLKQRSAESTISNWNDDRMREAAREK